ncbi:hypothetical protein GCM10010377_76400 [Streptomyces viridiviolaceus]|nr:hypothetical protein GCM10010377_76400 [Streptomyces viridiviolaceus]
MVGSSRPPIGLRTVRRRDDDVDVVGTTSMARLCSNPAPVTASSCCWELPAVRDPARIIPRAILIALDITLVVHTVVVVSVLMVLGPDGPAEA